jgi:hypothetical protein
VHHRQKTQRKSGFQHCFPLGFSSVCHGVAEEPTFGFYKVYPMTSIWTPALAVHYDVGNLNLPCSRGPTHSPPPQNFTAGRQPAGSNFQSSYKLRGEGIGVVP